jgi:Fe-S cluster biosynthesis and repair protein YggX
MGRLVNCIKLNKEADGLDFPPIPGEMGKKIWENVSKEAWNQWIQHQTMLVNEYRLNLSDIKARKYLMDQLTSYFFGSGNTDVASGYVPPKES